MPHEAALWERQPKERSKAFSLFCMYRDMGPERSLEKVRRQLGEGAISFTMLGRYSKNHEWVRRAEAYDDYLLKKQQQALEKRILTFKDQRSKEALAIADKAFEYMREDKTGSKESRKRWELGVDKFMQILGLDKKQVELSGEVTTNPDRLIHLKEALISTLSPEARMELSAKLMELALEEDGNRD